MHIGLCVPGWPVDEFPNGIVTYVHQLRRELIKQGHRVSVFTKRLGRTNTDTGIYLVEPPLTYRIRRKLSGLVSTKDYDMYHWGAAIAATVNRVCREDPIDVLEMEESFGWCADVQKRIPCPVVVKLHGPAFLTAVEEDLHSEMGAARIALEGSGLRQIAAIVSPSQSTLSDTVAHYGLHPRLSRVIPNPVAEEPGLKLWNVEACDRQTILFVGRFDKLKGGDTVLRAFRKLLEADARLKLIFVGPDRGLTAPGRPRIFFDEYRDSLFPEALRERIDYLGQVPRTDLEGLRRRAMVTIVVSRWENQGYTAIEAMLQGCPVISTAVGGMGEFIEHEVTGLLVRQNDIDDLCEKILSLLKDPDAASRFGRGARDYVIDKLSPKTIVENAIEVYKSVISLE